MPPVPAPVLVSVADMKLSCAKLAIGRVAAAVNVAINGYKTNNKLKHCLTRFRLLNSASAKQRKRTHYNFDGFVNY